MRKIAIIAISSIALFAACKKKENTSSLNTVTATVAGNSWKAKSSSVSISRGGAETRLVILADSNNTNLKLEIENFTGVGKYIITDTGKSWGYFTTYAPAVGSKLHKATSGLLSVTDNNIISEYETEIKGTYTFLADTLPVVDGVFTVHLILN